MYESVNEGVEGAVGGDGVVGWGVRWQDFRIEIVTPPHGGIGGDRYEGVAHNRIGARHANTAVVPTRGVPVGERDVGCGEEKVDALRIVGRQVAILDDLF